MNFQAREFSNVTATTPAGNSSVEAVDRHAVQRQLERVLASSGFRRCVQLARFLRFTVDQALVRGDGASKETLIGVEIFGRPPDYDPGTDPVVRVEARRLRHKLDEYYRFDGREDPIRIEVPKGGYAPAFEVRCATAAAGSIAVLPFSDHSGNGSLEALSDGLTLRLISKLALCGGWRVVSSTSVFQFKNRVDDVRKIGQILSASLVLEGSIRQAGNRFRCDTQLVSTSHGLHLWAGSFDSARRAQFAVEDDFADKIARGVQQNAGE